MNLYDFIEYICASRNITVTKMCRECKVSRGSLSDLKAGRIKTLSSIAIKKISSYFGMSIDDLLAFGVDCEFNEAKKISSTSNEVLDDVTAEILERLSRMSSAEKNRALGYLDSLLASQENDGGFLK